MISPRVAGRGCRIYLKGSISGARGTCKELVWKDGNRKGGNDLMMR
jgi:hypothetical protein